MEEEDILLLQGITLKGEVIQTSDIKLTLSHVQVFWWDKLMASHYNILEWVVKDVGVLKPCACIV